MSKFSYLSALVLLSASMSQMEATVTGTWTGSGGNLRWGTPGNWNTNPNVPGVTPGGTPDSATLGLVGTGVTITLGNAAGSASVSPELQTLTMGVTTPGVGTSYTIAPFGGSGTLAMTNNPTITFQNADMTLTGDFTIQVPVTLDAASSSMTINVNGSAFTLFDTTSRLTALMTPATLNIVAQTADQYVLAFQTKCAGNGFADNMTIVLNSPGATAGLEIENSTLFGKNAPSITISDFAHLTNNLAGAHIGNATAPITMGLGAVLNNGINAMGLNIPGTVVNALSFLVDNRGLTTMLQPTTVKNHGTVSVANDFTIQNSPISPPNPQGFVLDTNNVQTNPVTGAGQGTVFTVGGNLIIDMTSLATISTGNNASVSGAGPFVGNLFEISGAMPITLSNGTDLGNANTRANMIADSIDGAGNIGSSFSIANAPIVTSAAVMSTSEISNFNAMPVSNGATGALMTLLSADLTSGVVQCLNDAPTNPIGPGITGTGSTGAQTTIASDVIVGNLSELLVNNSYGVFGTNSKGAQVNIVNGSVTTTLEPFNSLNFIACVNFATVTGSNAKGSWLEITNGNLVLQNGLSMFPVATGLTCQNQAHINGSSTTYGAYTHIQNGNVLLSNNAQIACLNGNLGTVTTGGGIGAFIAIDNGTATFSMTDSTEILLENDGVMTNYGVGAQLNATPQLQMNSGTFSLLNTATLNTSPTFAVIGNLNGGITWTGGTISIANQNTMTPSQSITSGNGAQLNITGDLSMGSTCTLNLTNTFGLTSAIASELDLTGGLTLVSGSAVNLTNTGNASSGIGNLFVVFGNLLTAGDIILTNSNTTLSTASRGNELEVAGTFIQTAGFIVNQTTGSTPDGTSFGSLIRASAQPIQVQGGTFINNDRVQTTSLPVSHGALLAGSGTFEGLTIGSDTAVTSSGTVYPGNPTNTFTSPSGPTIGTMTINGTYTQNVDGNFFVNILNLGTFSRLHVLGAGTADLQGTVTVGMVPGANITISDTYNIIQTATSITNQSLNPTVILDSSYTSTLIPQIRYITGPITLVGAPGDNIVQLFFLQGPTPPPGTSTAPLLTSYSFSFETLFDIINRDNLILEREMQRMRLRYQREYTVSTRKSSSRSLGQANAPRTNIAFDQTPSIRTVANKTPAEGKDLAFARYQKERELQRMDEEMVCTYQDRPWNFFIGPVGDIGTIKTKQNQIGSDYWVAGGLTSFNYVFSQGGIGLFADYNHAKADVHRHWGNFNFDMAHSCLYGTYSPKQVPDLAFHSIVGGSYEWYHINRKTTTNTAKGKTHGGEFDALFTGEYVFSGEPCSDFPEHLTIIPRAGVQYIYVDANKYKEHGASTSDLTIHALHAKSLRSILDLWMKYSWEWTNVKFTPELNVGWQREFFDKNHKVYFTPISVALPTSSVRAFGAGRNTFLAGLDLFLEFYERFALEASYDFQWNSLIQDNGFYLGFHARF